MPDERFVELVGLACHDLRTPLATVGGFAKTLVREESSRSASPRFVEMIDEAAEQMSGLIEELGLAARLDLGPLRTRSRGGRYARARFGGRRRTGVGRRDGRRGFDGSSTRLDCVGVAGGPRRFASARSEAVTWQVEGRELSLAPVEPGAAPILDGSLPRDLGALVARLALESLGGTLAVEGERLRVTL